MKTSKFIKIILITLAIMGTISLFSCTPQKGGCYGTRGFIGYGHK
jgi:hypothetical protein